MTIRFRSHPLFRLFAAPRPKIEPIVAVTQQATDAELARLASGQPHGIDDFRYEAMVLIYGGSR